MQLFLDLLPVALFFVAYKFAGIYIATAVLIAGTLVATTASWFRHRKVSPMLIASTTLVLVFGGLTLLLHDAAFIKWKPTIVDWLFAVAFFASRFMRGPTLVQRATGEQVKLEPRDWNRLNFAWVLFFIASGASNLYVAYHFSESTWVNFKLFGLTGLMLVFILLQGVWLVKKAENATQPDPAPGSTK